MASAMPTSLGRYEILQELGRGAMGVVYLARDPLIGRRVAIKTFRTSLPAGDPDLQEFQARFIREAQSAGILSHPNIVTIHDVVEASDDGLAFIAMEYVEGTDLKEILRQGRPFSVSDVVQTVCQVASALDYAHRKGVIHRDIKPGNIILDREGRVKITDFGIARLETSDLTQDGQLLGTPNYMAPERIQGGTVDHRTDIFSLGVVLYEMLTRRKPFQGDSLTMVSHRIVYEPFTPLDNLVPGLPEAVVGVISRALAKKPEDRFPSAGELAADLQRATAPALHLELSLVPEGPAAKSENDPSATQDVGKLMETVATGTSPLAKRFARRPGLRFWAASGVLALALMAVAGAALWLGRPATTEAVAASIQAPGPTSEVGGPVAKAWEELESGRTDLAAGFLLAAVGRAPADPALVDLKQTLARELRARQQKVREEVHRLELLAAAQDEAALGRHDEALRFAEELLDLDPASGEALALREQVATSLERQRAAARAAAAAEAPEPEIAMVAEPEAEMESLWPPAEEAEEAEEAETAVAVSFFTELPEGVLTLYTGNTQVLRERFAFYERTGLLRSEPRAGRIDARLVLAAGPTIFRAYVARGGQPARMTELEGRLEGGGAVTLRIHLAADGSLRAWLEP
jgi:predicted Ser/Thr protein kinase/tetratricopeptide (TPR) repeat protein